MKRQFAAWPAAVGIWALLGCELGDGSGGNGPGLGNPVTVELVSTGSLDGYMRSDGNGATAGTPITGDLEGAGPTLANIGYRQFYSFDLSAIPPGSAIVSATLHVFQAAVGGEPYTDLGNVIVDHVDYGTTLDFAAYNAAPLTGNVGTLMNDATLAYRTLAVTARVQADLTAGRARSQYRLRFSLRDANNDLQSDYTQLTDGEFAGAQVPKLVVTYRPPVQ